MVVVFWNIFICGVFMDIAEELAKDQREVSVAKFFEKNKQMLGFGNKAKSLVTVIKECVDNSLDAAQDVGILPDILVEIEKSEDSYRVCIEDNGPGIVEDEVPKVFGKLLYGSRFEKRTQSLLPNQKIFLNKNGKIEIESISEFCSSVLNKGEKDGKVRNVKVPCFNRKTGKTFWRYVSNVIKHKNKNECYRIDTNVGRKIKVTGNHSLFTLNEGEIAEVNASKLESGDCILAPRNIPNIDKDTNFFEYLDKNYQINPPSFSSSSDGGSLVFERRIVKKYMFLLAFYIDKGSLRDNYIEFVFKDSQNKEANRLVDILFGLFGSNFELKSRKNKTILEVYDESCLNFIRSLYENIGKNQLPKFIFRMEETLQETFIKALSDIQKEQGTVISTKNERTALDSIYLCDMVGKPSIWEETLNLNGNKRYKIKICESSDLSLLNRENKNSIISIYSSDLCLLRINDVEKISSPEFVYDISVPGKNYENFLAGNNGGIYVKNSRGQQGIGVSAAVLYSQITTGKPAKIISKPKHSQPSLFKISIDTERNKPEIQDRKQTSWTRTHGLRIELDIKANMRGRKHLHRYLKQTAIVNPYARIHLIEPNGEFVFDRGTEKLPKKPEEIKPHPHGLKAGELLDLLESKNNQDFKDFLCQEFSKVGDKTAQKIISEFEKKLCIYKFKKSLSEDNKKLSSTPEDENLYKILEIIQENKINKNNNNKIEKIREFSPQNNFTIDKKHIKKLLDIYLDISDKNLIDEILTDTKVAGKLVDSMSSVNIQRPSTDCLSPIGEESLKKGLKKEFDGEFYSTVTRDSSVYKGSPFIVETGIIYGTDKGRLLRFANKVPLVYREGGCAITKAVESINWKTYNIDSDDRIPQNCIVVVHIASTNVPFTRESKDAIADIPKIKKEVERAIREILRNLKKYINRKSRARKREQKQKNIEKTLPQIAEKIGDIVGETPSINRSLSKVLNNVYVKKKSKQNETKIIVDNYSRSQQSLEMHSFADPSYIDISSISTEKSSGDLEVIELESEIDIIWNVEVKSDSKEKIRINTQNIELVVDTKEDAQEVDIQVDKEDSD